MREWSCCWKRVVLAWFCCFSFFWYVCCSHCMRTQARPFPANTKDITSKRPTWLYRGFTSYEQTEWLGNTLVRFCWHSISRIRKLASTFPSAVLCKKGQQPGKRPTWVCRGFTCYEQTEWWRITPIHTLNVRSQQQGISFHWWSFWQRRVWAGCTVSQAGQYAGWKVMRNVI